MGNLTSREALALRWAEDCNDPTLRDLPCKVELRAGAREVWLVAEVGVLEVFDTSGGRSASSYPVEPTLPPRNPR